MKIRKIYFGKNKEVHSQYSIVEDEKGVIENFWFDTVQLQEIILTRLFQPNQQKTSWVIN